MTEEKVIELLEKVEELNENTPDGVIHDADSLLKDIMDVVNFEFNGVAQDIFNIYKKASDKEAVKEMFFEFTDMEFEDFLELCEKEITRPELKKICPRCGCDRFIVTQHVAQTIVVDGNGNYISTENECDQVDHAADDDDVWACEKCGYSASGYEFNLRI